MYSVRRYGFFLLMWVVLALEVSADNLSYSKENPLKFGIDFDYAPLEYVNEKGEPSGLDIKFTEILLKRLNIPYTYSANTWENIAGDVLHGKVDLGMMVFSTYRQNETNYSRAVFKMYYQMITRKGESKGLGLRDVKGKKIAFMESRPVRDTLSKAGAETIIVKDLKMAINELSHGQYDAIICFRYQANFLINAYGNGDLEAEDLTLMSREYCYVSHDKQLIDTINVVLAELEKEGVIEEVYGGVKTSFGGLRIPMWIWFLLSSVVIVALVIVLIQQFIVRKRVHLEMVRAQKSEDLKDVFMSNISHALRTPLNAIIGFSDLIKSDESMGRDEVNTLMKLINKNGHQLLHLVNQLMSIGDIVGNKQLFDRMETDIDAEMRLFADEIRPQLKNGVRIDVVGPEGGLKVLLDPKLLRLVTMHMLENAMQHTKEGKIQLSYFMEGDIFHVEVKDTGEGVPEDMKANLFDMLNDKNAYTQEEAPGLGLSICKAIIDRCDGKVGYRENHEDGRGSVFWFWAPVQILNRQ